MCKTDNTKKRYSLWLPFNDGDDDIAKMMIDENDNDDGDDQPTTMFCFVANIPFILTTLATRPYLGERIF